MAIYRRIFDDSALKNYCVVDLRSDTLVKTYKFRLSMEITQIIIF